MELPKGDPIPKKKHLKGHLAHPVPPPSLPGQGRERRQRKRVERRGDPRGEARIGSERDTKCKCMGSAAAAGPGPRAEEEVREKRGGDPRGEVRMEGKRDTKCKCKGSAAASVATAVCLRSRRGPRNSTGLSVGRQQKKAPVSWAGLPSRRPSQGARTSGYAVGLRGAGSRRLQSDPSWSRHVGPCKCRHRAAPFRKPAPCGCI